MSNEVMLEDLMKIISNKYLAVNIAARRARQLNEGAVTTVETDAAKKPTIALEELFAEKLNYQILQRGELVAIEEQTRLEAVFEVDDAEGEEPLLEEEYVDDTRLAIDDEEPEEGI